VPQAIYFGFKPLLTAKTSFKERYGALCIAKFNQGPEKWPFLAIFEQFQDLWLEITQKWKSIVILFYIFHFPIHKKFQMLQK